MVKLFKVVALGLSLAISGMAAGATTYSFTETRSGNDCSGVLGTPPNCTLNGSPMIGKIDFQKDGTMAWTSGVFGDLSSLFSFNVAFNDGKWANTGTFTYTPGATNPGITGFTVKGGSGFNVFTTTDPVFLGQSAEDVSFFAPNNRGGRPAGVSHIVFFDTLSVAAVPLPAAAWLLLTALGGLAVAGRRRRAA